MPGNENISVQQWSDSSEKPIPGQRMSAVKIIILMICCITALFLFAHYQMDLGTFRGSSFEECRKRVRGSFYSYKLPDDAEDFRFICHNYGLGANSAEAFTLHDTEYDEFVEEVKKKEPGSVVGYHDDLDFAGMKVSETADYYDTYGNYIGFPTDRIEYVIDDDINDYTILYYDAYEGSGSEINAIATNPETGRIVIYSYGSN
ncbi:hypothetical protein SAMN02910447_03570 [Ruminococcus sp. YE71]|uniref:hypothetical protein n=1 Tax=unclassified Ruminococcus TaxID=2608920 RepID=UPI00088557A1|nr:MULTISPECIES: hypothetical protein [unclassified Ruminococcus]SDA32904.1 hypothetical protein SAMN02910446_03667 [Ruminococcus sp. YE78]SFW53910.1 hypothetical protein SAMN02910447_03570 [Ruminococcus sp. YE71]